MLATAQAIAALPLDGSRSTSPTSSTHVLGDMYLQGQYRPMEMTEYIETVCDFLERLPPGMVVHRLTGDPPRDLLLAPQWALQKWQVLNAIHTELARRESFQGRRWAREQTRNL